MKDLSLYIHIPFCKKRCYYCDFVTFADRDEKIDRYVDYLLEEIGLYGRESQDYLINTIFIGGGTPSYIDEDYIKKIMDKVYASFKIRENPEITIEVNPGSLTRDKLKAYKDAGINRLSMGLQTLDDRILRKIGRIHNSGEFFDNYRLAREEGFDNINVDLMFDLPDQTGDILMDTLEQLVELGPEHISLYSLIFEEGTKLTRDYKEGNLVLANEDEERDMYHRGVEFLKDEGYDHYEISNFARKGSYSEHNIRYWDIVPYLGLGLASHSLYEGNRFYNVRDFEDYFRLLDEGKYPIEDGGSLAKDDEILEYIIMRLRLIEGIDKELFRERFGVKLEDLYGDALGKNIDNGLLLDEEGFIRFSPRGLDISNQVYLDFMP